MEESARFMINNQRFIRKLKLRKEDGPHNERCCLEEEIGHWEYHSHIWWLRSRVTNASHSASLCRRFRHSTLHHTSHLSLVRDLRKFTASISFLKLDPFNILLILNLFFHILVSLEEFIVLGLTELQSLIEVALKLLFKGIHLVLLLLNQLGLGGNDLFVSLLHVFFSFLYFELLACSLDLMCLSISENRTLVSIFIICKTYFFYLARFAWIFCWFKSSELNLNVNGRVYSKVDLFVSIS